MEFKNGCVCPKCNSENSTVYDSRKPADLWKNSESYGDWRIRRRKCKDCGFKWVTVELHWWDAQKLLENFGESVN